MMEKNKSLIKYSGQILLILALELIILLFRIAVPVGANIYGLSNAYTDIAGEFIYFVIQLFLIVIIVNHFIFKKSYSSMGLVELKQNIFSFVGNLFYLAIIAVATILLTKISGETYQYTIMQAIASVILIFVSRAFMQEVIYRGCIMDNFNKMFKNTVVAIICSSLLFAIVHLSLGVIDSGFETSYISGLSMKFIGAFLMGAYLGSLYYVTNNIWICIILHGTYASIPVLGYEILIPVFEGIYVACAILYLIYEVVSRRKLREADEYDEDSYDNVEYDTKETSSQPVVQNYTDNNLEPKNSDIEFMEHSDDIRIDTANGLAKPDTSSSNLEEEYKEEHKDDNKVEYKEPNQEATVDKSQEVEPDINEPIDFNKTTVIRIDDIERADRENKANEYINHLKSSLGELIGTYQNMIYADLSISVLAFEGDKFNALVTNGIRLKPMNVPEYLEGNAYAEMVIFVSKEFDITEEGMQKEENSWIMDVLNDTIGQLKTTDNYLGWGHTFENSNMKPYNNESKLCGVFIYPPVVQEDMTFYTFKEEGKTTYIYSAMPIYKEELELILQTSGDVYFTKLKESNVSQIVYKDRINICKDTSLI